MRPIKGSQSHSIGIGNGKYKRGYIVNEKGYIRYTAGLNRGKYQHRVVCEELLKSPISYVLLAWNGKIPKNITIHHCNGDRQDNKIHNLMFLEKVIHDFISLRRVELFRLQADEVPF